MTDDQRAGGALGLESARSRPGAAREVINEMLDAGLLDDLMARVDSGGLALTGEGWFLAGDD